MNSVLDLNNLRHCLKIGYTGSIGIAEVKGHVVKIVAFIGTSELDETNEMICQALLDAFGHDCDPCVELIGRERRRCVFTRDLGECVRNERGLMLSVQRCFSGMIRGLQDSQSGPCD